MQRANIYTGEYEYDETDPDGYHAGAIALHHEVAARELNVVVFELPPGQSVCPYHYEYNEEWLVALDGPVMVRTPDGEEQLASGDAVCFPAGPAGAHKATNHGTATVRLMMFSAATLPSVAVYPDSDKIGVKTGNPDDKVRLHRADGHVDYWVGETPEPG